ncbi:MAG: DUF1080 domain-containing protein [Gemmatimonadaceae bacterium]|jgi:hypothetical protein|nr:DUF1080 domain-containing protein [Gemmatimonadaceae bacterium]
MRWSRVFVAACAWSAIVSLPAPAQSGWRSLFDGRTTAGWHHLRQSGPPTGWGVVDGALTRTGPGGDIVSADQFANFELALEWKISPGGNSGIFYRVDPSSEKTHESGAEMQVLDDARHADGKSRLTSAGALYALVASPPGHLKPVGEWNAVRIVVNGAHVEHWLNGTKVVEYELWSPDWERRVRESKFSEVPTYGRARRGHIALQDHGDWVAYRNIRIRELP